MFHRQTLHLLTEGTAVGSSTTGSNQAWTTGRKPACFDTLADWRYWMEACIGTHEIPCTTCTPAFKSRMCAMKRCQRPETIFVVSPNTGDLIGYTSAHRDYGRMLRGDVGAMLKAGTWPEWNTMWRDRIRRALVNASRPSRYDMQKWLMK